MPIVASDAAPFAGHDDSSPCGVARRRPNESTLSSRRHEVLRSTLTRGFEKREALQRRATKAAACLLLRSVSRRRAGTRRVWWRRVLAHQSRRSRPLQLTRLIRADWRDHRSDSRGRCEDLDHGPEQSCRAWGAHHNRIHMSYGSRDWQEHNESQFEKNQTGGDPSGAG